MEGTVANVNDRIDFKLLSNVIVLYDSRVEVFHTCKAKVNRINIKQNSFALPKGIFSCVCVCMYVCVYLYTRWFKYDRDKLWLVYTQIVPVIFEPPCIWIFIHFFATNNFYIIDTTIAAADTTTNTNTNNNNNNNNNNLSLFIRRWFTDRAVGILMATNDIFFNTTFGLTLRPTLFSV